MLRFIRGRGPHASSERLKHHKDVFTFQKTVPHGFPHHPTALAYDEELQLIALTTKKGQLRIYGQPGVEYYTDIDSDSPVRLIQFIPEKRGEIILLHDDGAIQHFEINLKSSTNEPTLDKVKASKYFERNENDSSKHATTLTAVSSTSTSADGVSGRKSITIYVGTQSGDVYSLDLDTFVVSSSIIQQETVLANVPAEVKKSNQGSVEVIAPQPNSSGKLLIGYQRGLLILWNVESNSAEKFYNSSQQLQSASWQSQGDEFITSHNDGSYIIWNEGDNLTAREGAKTPYGPFPCKPITKILRKTTNTGDDYLVLSGGMPRASFGEKFTVSIIQGDLEGSNRHHVLDFTSRVIDFITIDSPSDGKDNPIALIVLLDEEIVAIDLTTPDWLQFKLPYLSSVHSSGIICCQHYSDLPDDVIQLIFNAGAKQDEGKYSSNNWPVLGGVLFNSTPAVDELASSQLDTQQLQTSEVTGENDSSEPVASSSPSPSPAAAVNDDQDNEKVDETKESNESQVCNNLTSNQSSSNKDILVTGHEDGSVCFWDASRVNLSHILTVHTRKLFIAPDGDIAPIDGDDIPTDSLEDEWPPFRKVGTFDPYSDDGRLAIQRITLCPMTGSFVAAGTAGQVIVMKISPDTKEVNIPVVSTNLVEEASGFTWKGHDQLHVKNGPIKLDPGYQAEMIVQITPPAAVTALSINSEWALLAAGTAHGFVVFDCLANKVLFTKTTLNLADLAATSGGDVLISRRKSFKKSLRESFRRLRKGRSLRGNPKKTPSSPTSTDATSSSASSSKVTSPVRSLASAALDDETRPVERQIEAKQDDGLGSMVRTLYFALSPITSNSSPQASLWVGTNAGTVFLYSITLPSDDKRTSELVTVQLAKEIQLKHKAPVIFIQVVDSTGYPIPGPYEVAKGKAKAPSSVGSQRVLIVSEEQFKLFTLPSLKPERKTKLTAHEGSRVRKVAVAHFTSKLDEKFTEHCMVCLSNQGEVAIYSIGDLKRLRNQAITKRDDVHGMASLVFTSDGEGFYLHTPSEFMRFTMSSKKVITATGYVAIPEDARPARDEQVDPAAAAATAAPVAASEAVETAAAAATAAVATPSSDIRINESSNRNVILEQVDEEEEITEDEKVNASKNDSNALSESNINSTFTSQPNHSTPVASEIDVSSLVSPLQGTVSPIKVPETSNNDSVTLSNAATTAVNAANVVTLQPEDLEPMSLTTVSEVDTPSSPLPDSTADNSTLVTHEVIHSESVTNGKVNGHPRKGNNKAGKSKAARAKARAAAAAAAAASTAIDDDGDAAAPTAADNNGHSSDGKQLQCPVSNGSDLLTHSLTGNGHEADESIVTSDITIDSVKDFTNLSISDQKQQNLLSEQRPESGLKGEQRPGSALKGEKPKRPTTPASQEQDEEQQQQQQVDDQLMELLVDNFQ